MEREEIIKALVACNECALAQEELEELSDKSLASLHAKFLKANEEEETEEEEKKKPKTPEPEAPKGEDDEQEPEGNEAKELAPIIALIKDAGGAEAVKEALSDLTANTSAERQALIKALTANKQAEFTKEELGAMPLPMLRKLLASVAPEEAADYSGRGLIRTHREEEDEDAIPAPPPVVLAKPESQNGTQKKAEEAA